MYDVTLKTADVTWTPTPFPGTAIRVLHQDDRTGGRVVMTRLAAGAVIPPHRHANADETVYVLSGDFVEDGVSHPAGTFLVAAAGTIHGPLSSVGGCVILTTFSAETEFEGV